MPPKIDTVVILMLENRSFDHMLGHLSLPTIGNGSAVDGLKAPLTQYKNRYKSETFNPFRMPDGKLICDLPHERREVESQLGYSKVSDRYTMGGFAKAYFDLFPNNRPTQPDTMGFLTADDIPVTRFLADNYAVCDRWFAPLPTSTQPNRLMALAGETLIDQTSGLFPARGKIVLDWLESNEIRWRVYHSGISFFALLGCHQIFGPNFRRLNRLAADVFGEKDNDFPQVIYVEPAYGDAPRLGGDLPNDNHPPISVAPGEALIKRVYDALTCNQDRWARTVFILTYDEHGGFFDHVAPPGIPYRPGSDATFTTPFETLGVRVPTLIVSPSVSAQCVVNQTMDHTSILQLLADVFTPGSPFSKRVQQRAAAGINSASQTLNLESPRTDIPAAPAAPRVMWASMAAEEPVQLSKMQEAFRDAALEMTANNPRETAQQYPEIMHWKLAEASRGRPK